MALSKEEVAKLYVATFNRAPDSAGLEYWINDSGINNIVDLASSMLESQEAAEIYPENTTYEDFVASMYQNMFNRYADEEGLAYWTKELENGSLTRSVMIQALIDGAAASTGGADDKAVIENKTTIGLTFADAGLNDAEAAKSIMSEVGSNSSTVAKAKALINQAEVQQTHTVVYEEIHERASEITIQTKTDTAANFINETVNLQGMHNAVITGKNAKDDDLTKVADITAIDELTRGSVTVASVTDTAANLDEWSDAKYGTNTVVVTALGATPGADLSKITASTMTSTVALANSTVNFTGKLGSTVITLDGTNGGADDVFNVENATVGTATFSVDEDATLKGSATQLDGITATGSGTVYITKYDEAPSADISKLTTTSMSVEFSNDCTYTGDLGDATAYVANGAVLSTTLDIVNAKTINKAGSTGAVKITGLTTDTVLSDPTGSANIIVEGVTYALDATNVTKNLSVVVAADPAVSVATGSGSNTITAYALTDGQVLTVTGDDDATIYLNGGDLAAGTGTGRYTVNATAGTNVITVGDSYNNEISAGNGDDTITVGNGTNTITGGAGADNITVGDGQNTLIYEGVAELFSDTSTITDTISTGSGTTTISITGTGNDIDSSYDWSGLTGSGIDKLYTTGNFESHADFATDTGITTIYTSGEYDRTIDISNLGTADMTVIGSAANDVIRANAGGATTVNGGAGSDTIALGAGGKIDTIVVSSGNACDKVSGFVEGEDKIKLSISGLQSSLEGGKFNILNTNVYDTRPDTGDAVRRKEMANDDVDEWTSTGSGNIGGGADMVVLTGATYADADAVLNDIYASGGSGDAKINATSFNNTSTGNGVVTSEYGGFFIVYGSDDGNAYLAAVTVTSGNNFFGGRLTNLVEFTGYGAVNTGDFDNFLFI